MSSPSSPLTTLTDLAVQAFASYGSPDQDALERLTGAFQSGDPLINEQIRLSVLSVIGGLPSEQLADAIFAASDLGELRSRSGELDPMVIQSTGAVRMGPAGLLTTLFTSARQQVLFLGLPADEGTYVRLVLANFDELRRAVRGEKVRSYYLVGFSGVTPPVDLPIETPWGIARRAPEVRPSFTPGVWFRPTSMILAIPELSEVRFDRASSPEMRPIESGLQKVRERALQLFPLSIALATNQQGGAAPVPTWMTSLSPFITGFSWSSPLIIAPPSANVELDFGQVRESSDWSRIVEQRHHASIDVSARRIVSAISQRLDAADKLIDAVMVWENLVGTRVESTFRVTAALVKLLQRDKSQRDDARRRLAEIYDVRSRVVHGDLVENEDVRLAADRAVDTALGALRVIYRDRADFLELKSTARADRLLLEEP